MSVLGIDLGGTKLASALFNKEGDILTRQTDTLGSRRDTGVGGVKIYITSWLEFRNISDV